MTVQSKGKKYVFRNDEEVKFTSKAGGKYAMSMEIFPDKTILWVKKIE